MNEIDFNFEATLAKPTDELPTSYEHKSSDVSHPPQDADSDEYLCGSAGPGFPGNTPGRDQDRSRLDEYTPAQGCARYVS